MMREIRDRLGGVSEQWRTAGNLLRASAKGGLAAFECWSLVNNFFIIFLLRNKCIML